MPDDSYKLVFLPAKGSAGKSKIIAGEQDPALHSNLGAIDRYLGILFVRIRYVETSAGCHFDLEVSSAEDSNI